MCNNFVLIERAAFIGYLFIYHHRIKWAFFNEYFEDVLGFRTATGYSALWKDYEAWEEYEDALYDLCHQKK